MTLLRPEDNIRWKDYSIDTPTFELRPVEKPDCSPFLIHLTQKNSLLNILKGNACPVERKKCSEGFLKSSIPVYDSESLYNSQVVCFTETPIFALDFFRYRSFPRWNYDQQYGIGFFKSYLILEKGVRPVIYLDNSSNKTLLSLIAKFEEEQNFDETQKPLLEIYEKTSALLKGLKPLLFPMLEEHPLQGFMWEREWRYPKSDGFTFPYSKIEIICCPSNEKQDILDVLGDLSENIAIIENWREYDEVTYYLKGREQEINDKEIIEEISDLDKLKDLKEKKSQHINTLNNYYYVLKQLINSKLDFKSYEDSVNEAIKRIELQIEKISSENDKNKSFIMVELSEINNL